MTDLELRLRRPHVAVGLQQHGHRPLDVILSMKRVCVRMRGVMNLRRLRCTSSSHHHPTHQILPLSALTTTFSSPLAGSLPRSVTVRATPLLSLEAGGEGGCACVQRCLHESVCVCRERTDDRTAARLPPFPLWLTRVWDRQILRSAEQVHPIWCGAAGAAGSKCVGPSLAHAARCRCRCRCRLRCVVSPSASACTSSGCIWCTVVLGAGAAICKAQARAAQAGRRRVAQTVSSSCRDNWVSRPFQRSLLFAEYSIRSRVDVELEYQTKKAVTQRPSHKTDLILTRGSHHKQQCCTQRVHHARGERCKRSGPAACAQQRPRGGRPPSGCSVRPRAALAAPPRPGLSAAPPRCPSQQLRPPLGPPLPTAATTMTAPAGASSRAGTGRWASNRASQLPKMQRKAAQQLTQRPLPPPPHHNEPPTNPRSPSPTAARASR
jgi:hypothetical protein